MLGGLEVDILDRSFICEVEKHESTRVHRRQAAGCLKNASHSSFNSLWTARNELVTGEEEEGLCV